MWHSGHCERFTTGHSEFESTQKQKKIQLISSLKYKGDGEQRSLSRTHLVRSRANVSFRKLQQIFQRLMIFSFQVLLDIFLDKTSVAIMLLHSSLFLHQNVLLQLMSFVKMCPNHFWDDFDLAIATISCSKGQRSLESNRKNYYFDKATSFL